MKVLMVPSPARISGDRTSGIDQVVTAYAKHLPEFGIELVTENDAFDLIAVHAGVTGSVNDVAHLHGLHWSGDYDAPEWEYRVNARIAEAVRHAKQITVPSEWVAETIRRDLRVNPTVIPHGIDWADWQHDEPKGGYVLWNKNRVDNFVCDAMPVVSLAKDFVKQQFVTTFLPKGAEPLSNVNVIGLIPHKEMKKLVQSAAVYLATVKETWGIGILEAMAAGVPVLGYAHGGITDLVEHGINGYLARPGDTAGLAEGLRYCLKHRRVLGSNGTEMAKMWTWQAACDKVAEVYRRAAEPELPTVGVVIPVYNKTGQELERAVDSVIRQTYDKLVSIIVVDDGSKDETIARDIVQAWTVRDVRIQLVRQRNSGVAVARNVGIARAGRVKYVCCLDADDWLEPDFLRVCVEALEQDRSLGIAYTGLRWHKPDGSTGVSEWPGQWDYDAQLRRRNQVPTCCVFRRVMWERLGGYRQRYAPHGAGSEDAELWTRAGAYGFKAAKVTKDALFNYSWMSGHVTGDPNYSEPDWLAWHPWAKDGQHPFASYARSKRASHPVRAYDKPVVSVIIPVGPGHETAVIDALDSLEAQTFRKWEVIVVWDREDHPPDNLKKAYPYVRWRWWGENRGAGFVRNSGAGVARAPLLLFLDADDWLHPEALQKMVAAWNSKQAIVYTDYVGRAHIEPDKIKNLAPNLRHKLYNYDERKQEALIGYRAFDFDCERVMRQPELPNPYIWCNITAILPKVWHDEIGGFDEGMESWEDYDYHLRHARAGHCYYHLEEELLMYRFYTGGRREHGRQNHKNLVQYLTDKYAKEGDVVGCRGCPGGRSQRAAPVQAQAVPAPAVKATAETPGDDSEFVRVRLMDNKRGAHSLQIKRVAVDPRTGRRFDYGVRSHGDVFMVHKDDVWMVNSRTGQLDLVNPGVLIPVEEQQVNLPPSQPVETPPPKPIGEDDGSLDTKPLGPPEPIERPFDPQAQLPGITPKIAQEILARFSSLDEVRQASIEDLTEVPGIGQKRAEKIIKYLSQ